MCIPQLPPYTWGSVYQLSCFLFHPEFISLSISKDHSCLPLLQGCARQPVRASSWEVLKSPISQSRFEKKGTLGASRSWKTSQGDHLMFLRRLCRNKLHYPAEVTHPLCLMTLGMKKAQKDFLFVL